MSTVRPIFRSRNLALGGDDLGLPEVKDHLRVEGDSQDGVIQGYITGSLGTVEEYTGFWVAIWEVDAEFAAVAVLPRAVAIGETARRVAPTLHYVDELGDDQTAPIEVVTFDALNRVATLELPEVAIEENTVFRVTYSTRRPEAGSKSITVHSARLLIVGALFINRDSGEVMPPGARMLLDSFRQNQA